MRYFLQGLLLGFAIAAPVGPIGLLCIQRTLNQGRVTGLVSGMGAASADAVYGFIAAFGLTMISAFLLEQQLWLGIAGGLYLCYLGVRMALAAPATEAAVVEGNSLVAAYASTFMLTLTNPMTILFFVAVYAGAGLAAGVGDYVASTWLVIGVFLGSAGWWLLLSSVTSLFRTRINAAVLRWVNVAAGVVIVGFGLFALWSVRG
jgi:threonine/homoserine/homoserine lactone efflux protein